MPLPSSPSPLFHLDSSRGRQIRFKMDQSSKGSATHSLRGSPCFSPLRSPSPPRHFTTTTYHTNALNLFQNETGVPVFSGEAPTLTNLVPPEPDHEHGIQNGLPNGFAFGKKNALLQDTDRIGGWGEDEVYIEHGRIEEVDDEDDVNITIASIAKPLSPEFSILPSLPSDVPPPPRPRVRAFDIAPESPATLQARLHQTLSDQPAQQPSPLSRTAILRARLHQTLSDHPVRHPSPLFRNLPSMHSAEPTGTLSPLNVFEPSRRSTPIPHQSFAIPPDDVPIIPSIPTSSPPYQDEPVVRPIKISRSPTPPPPPPKDKPLPCPTPVHPSPQKPVSIAPKVETIPLNDETIIAQNLLSIGKLSSVVLTISKSIFHSTTPKTVQSHIDTCNRVIESLSQVEKALIRRREVPQEYWEHFPVSSRCRYERRLKSLERSLRRLRIMSEHILGGQFRLLEVVVEKFAKHHAKLQDVADKLNATFDRLKLRHLHKIASKHVAQANVCRTAYLDARETYFGKRPQDRKTKGNFRDF